VGFELGKVNNQISLDNPSVPASARVKAALELSRAGLSMIRGQVHDMRQDLDGGTTEEDRLLRCYLLKSAALYGAATKMGGILTGAADNEAAKLEAAGTDLGFSYQFLDDVADVVAGVAEVGKERGMDAAKLTAVDLFGVDGARRNAREFQDRSLAQLEAFGAKADGFAPLFAKRAGRRANPRRRAARCPSAGCWR
jgi:geranylgeranyl pyrophosphate synthase